MCDKGRVHAILSRELYILKVLKNRETLGPALFNLEDGYRYWSLRKLELKRFENGSMKKVSGGWKENSTVASAYRKLMKGS